MKKNLRLLGIVFCRLLISAIIVVNISCADPQGCTDPNALNYDEIAKINDGSCEYEGSKYVGEYTGSILCGDILQGITMDSASFQITLWTEYPDELQIYIPEYYIGFTGMLTENLIEFNTELQLFLQYDINNDGTLNPFHYLKITGSGSFSEYNNFSAVLVVTIVNLETSSELIDQCTLIGTKVS